MSLTLEQALAIAKRKVAEIWSGIEVRVLDATVQEFGEGWVFSYQSARFLDTADFAHMLMSAKPLFVAKDNGKTFFLSPHDSYLESMAAYRACGNPNATPIAEIDLLGWETGANAIAAIQCIRRHSSLGLSEAKSIIDRCLRGDRCVVRASDVEQAKSMVATLASAGFKSHIRYG